MKKTYIRPEMTIFGMHTEDMILAGSGDSIEISPNPTPGVDQMSDEKGGWNSESWTNNDSESRF